MTEPAITVADLYDEATATGRARRRSIEWDFGALWHHPLEPIHGRVTYIEFTGEIYAIWQRRGRGAEIRMLGTLRAHDRLEADRALEGWEQMMHRQDGIYMLRLRIATEGTDE